MSMYHTWEHRFGTPWEVADHIQKNPHRWCTSIEKYVANMDGKEIAHIYGAQGSLDVALSLLGAKVTVMYPSMAASTYSQRLAQAASVDIHHIIADGSLHPWEARVGTYDLVLLEFAWLKDEASVEMAMSAAATLLKSGGQLMIQDTHSTIQTMMRSSWFERKGIDPQIAQSLDMTPAILAETSEKKGIRHIITALSTKGLFVRLIEKGTTPQVHTVHESKDTLKTILAEKL
ncbi:MAG: hypothetical protein OWR52_01520 [Acidibacillus sp.]|nr:hypothetical protein [Acidibacillus sp.]